MTAANKQSEARHPKEDSGIDVEIYNKIVNDAQLVDLRLVSNGFQMKTSYFVAMKADEGAQLKFQYKCDSGIEIHKDEDFMFIGKFDWSVNVVSKRKKVLDIKAGYLALFRSNVGEAEKEIEFFVKRVGQNATYPYFRALVNFLSGESRAELPTLPMLRQEPINK